MPAEPCDLLIRAGRLISPSFNGPGAIAVRGDRIVEIGHAIQGPARQAFEFPTGIALPGLIDLHAHPACAGSIFGVDPDSELLPYGTTTVLSQGDAGAHGWKDFVRHTIERSRTRIRLALNLSAIGETRGACFSNIDDVDVEACVRAFEEDAGQYLWGIAANVSHVACGKTDAREVLARALLAAERTGKPLLYGMRRPQDWSFAEQMKLLRPGDVVTYCYRREPHCIVENGKVHPAICDARQRGILFDVGHGMGSFDFATAEAAIGDGFPPDTISTDYQARHCGQALRHTLPRVMAKLRAAGMTEADTFAAVTSTPARILGITDIGRLAPGNCADITVLEWQDQAELLTDVHGASRPGGCWRASLVVRHGVVCEPPR